MVEWESKKVQSDDVPAKGRKKKMKRRRLFALSKTSSLTGITRRDIRLYGSRCILDEKLSQQRIPCSILTPVLVKIFMHLLDGPVEEGLGDDTLALTKEESVLLTESWEKMTVGREAGLEDPGVREIRGCPKEGDVSRRRGRSR